MAQIIQCSFRNVILRRITQHLLFRQTPLQQNILSEQREITKVHRETNKKHYRSLRNTFVTLGLLSKQTIHSYLPLSSKHQSMFSV